MAGGPAINYGVEKSKIAAEGGYFEGYPRRGSRGNFTNRLVELYHAADVVIDLPTLSAGATAPLAICASALHVLAAQRAMPATGISAVEAAKRA